MNYAERYPLPVAVGVLSGGFLGALLGWWLWAPGRELWALGAGVGLALVVGVLLGAFIWSKFPTLCGLVVCLIPACWAAHATYAGALTEGRQGASGHREKEPLKIARIKATPHISGGALRIPIKTTSGGLNRTNAQKIAEELAHVFTLSSARVEYPGGRRNAGYVWVILGAEDMTA